MGKKLVIVESPAKSKTIGRYLGSDYIISASLGHIRDLPSGNLGVDVKNNFKPLYITMKGKEKVVRDLKLLAADADEILLATDPDREGEAIAWHLAKVLKIDPDSKCRITFNEITKLERNGMFVYESVPGTAVTNFCVKNTEVSFTVSGAQDAQITIQLEDDMDYEVFTDGAAVGGMKTNMSGKLSLSVELSEGKAVDVKVVRK